MSIYLDLQGTDKHGNHEQTRVHVVNGGILVIASCIRNEFGDFPSIQIKACETQAAALAEMEKVTSHLVRRRGFTKADRCALDQGCKPGCDCGARRAAKVKQIRAERAARKVERAERW